MNELKISDLNIQPVTFFEVKGLFLVTLFPSIFQGFTAVLCGKEKDVERVLTIHECTICKANGHENCPYVKEAVNFYKQHVGNDYKDYRVIQKEIVPDPRWTQFSKEETAELIKKVKESAESTSEHNRSRRKEWAYS